MVWSSVKTSHSFARQGVRTKAAAFLGANARSSSMPSAAATYRMIIRSQLNPDHCVRVLRQQVQSGSEARRTGTFRHRLRHRVADEPGSGIGPRDAVPLGREPLPNQLPRRPAPLQRGVVNVRDRPNIVCGKHMRFPMRAVDSCTGATGALLGASVAAWARRVAG